MRLATLGWIEGLDNPLHLHEQVWHCQPLIFDDRKIASY